MLKKKYNIPSGQEFVLMVWDVGCGYLRDSPREDYFCFPDMTSEKNCIEKITFLRLMPDFLIKIKLILLSVIINTLWIKKMAR
ncbi:DUF943 family protein [Enterobacter sp. RHBSTW-00901]|nr:DUF943 family protein [Enterobacter sp. RHBSTW-00901]